MALALAVDVRAAARARIKRATLAAHRDVERLDRASLAELQRMYREAAEDVAERIRQYGQGDDTITITELRSLRDQLEQRLAELGRLRDGLLGAAVNQAVDLGIRPFGLPTAASMQINQRAVLFLRNYIAEDGLQLSDRIWRLDRQARDLVVNAVERAVIQGHGAAQAALELLARGDPVPLDVQAKRAAGRPQNVAAAASAAMLTGTGTPLENAMRVMRTEINRAHGEAYMMSGPEHPDFAGWRYLLSPAHPKPDICDLLSTQNLYGLGPGVYPSREKTPWPAHPNTLSFVEVVFRDEVTDADRAGKETPLQALGRLTPEQRDGALGKGKHQAFKDGQLTQGMIRAPLSAVKKRIGQAAVEVRPRPPAAVVRTPPVRPPAPTPPRAPKTLDEFIDAGGTKLTELLDRAKRTGRDAAEVLPELLFHDLNTVRSTKTPAKLMSKGAGAKLVEAASQLFPDAWTGVADRAGPLYAKGIDRLGRAHQVSLTGDFAGRAVRVPGFGRVVAKGGDGFITTGSFRAAVHEYSHRLQATVPGLDDFFQELHHRRTSRDPLKRLRDLPEHAHYPPGEVTREDRYIEPYQGREYRGAGVLYMGKHGALEVMTMAFEHLLGGRPPVLARALAADREMVNLAVGLLYRYAP